MATKKPSKAAEMLKKVQETEQALVEKVKVATGMKKTPPPRNTRELVLVYILVILVVFLAGIYVGKCIGYMHGKGHMYKHGGYDKQMKYSDKTEKKEQYEDTIPEEIEAEVFTPDIAQIPTIPVEEVIVPE